MAKFELPKKFVSQYPHKFAQGKNRYLRGERILPPPLTGRETVEELMDRAFLAYNGGRLQQAGRLMVEKMLGANVTVGLSLSGAMTPAGVGSSCLAPLIRAGFVDWIVSTGANLYHDMHHAMNLPLYRGSPFLTDPELRRCGVVRIYDILLDYNDVLMRTDDVLRRILRQPEFQKEMGTAELHYRLGRYYAELERRTGARNTSMLAAAYRAGVPCFCSSPGDSTIGMNVAGEELAGNRLRVNPSIDVNESTAIVLATQQAGHKTAAVLIGGGSPKNFLLQTEPQIQEVVGAKVSGHDYFLQITDARPDTGGLSGATPNEAVTWGKVQPQQLPDAIVCYLDTTVALPLLTHYALAKHRPRRLKRLYDRLPGMVERLKREYAKHHA
ncbi:MAG TPA: deoxyhypusine synthase [Verrucomicrobiota bacterium]|nr:deoxyhypusine synthase [Verrucomicrobiota bacterium]HQL77145.1 deoxyhypusine synthase [Verrucomicrobiota bacterium]